MDQFQEIDVPLRRRDDMHCPECERLLITFNEEGKALQAEDTGVTAGGAIRRLSGLEEGSIVDVRCLRCHPELTQESDMEVMLLPVQGMPPFMQQALRELLGLAPPASDEEIDQRIKAPWS